MIINWGTMACFAGIAPNIVERLDAAAHEHSYQAGATIFNEGDACAGFHVVVEGLVRIYRISPEGRLHTLSLLRPTASFNEVAAVDGRSNPYNAVTLGL